MNSVVHFEMGYFDQERMNPALEAKLFTFRMPAGAELVESTQ